MEKIAIVIPGFLPVPAVLGGGVEQLITTLLEQNDLYGSFQIDLYTLDHDLIRNIEFNNTNIIRIKSNHFNIIVEKIINYFFKKINQEKNYSYFGSKTAKIIKMNKYSKIIIENNMYIYKKVFESYNKSYNCDFYFHLHNDIGGKDKPLFLCKYIAKTSKAVITCSDYLNRKYKSITGFKNTFTLNNIVDHNCFYFDEKSRFEIRNKFDLNGKFVYTYVGRISEEKGIFELIKAFKLIKNQQILLMIVGDFNDSVFGKKMSSLIKDDNRIVCCGSISNNQVFKYMSASDCVIIPTICEEAFGLVALEAVYCKRRLIISNSGGLIDLVGNNAEIVDRYDIVNNLKKKMEFVFKKNMDNFENNSFEYPKNIIQKYEYDKYYPNFCDILKR